ncbi:hypothetical protein [Jeongeupia chitinilytica]|uniref:Uncharacterized protein n=1 Tax=Jeongeupia chitinilytica TaxID=1041641 RepID=A0ABQ3GXV6_9NEIS|nr:hypothetical protein [Jeongeupia chitinilytica]GHD57912.1 hypothetical protein GCM10007350_06930 [Jeongeupia chitinilytica]
MWVRSMFGLTMLAASIGHAAPLPDAAATITYESRVVTAEGVTKQTRFQERWLRSKDKVWSERIVPANALPESAHDGDHGGEHDHHHDMNFATAAKYVYLDPKGAVALNFVRPVQKTVIVMGKGDYAQVGFDGSWEAAATLIDRKQLDRMSKLSKPAPAGANWYEQRQNKQYVRVLWSSAQQLPLTIETGRDDGSSWSRISVARQAVPARWPWADIAGYTRKDYMDLLD